MREFRTIELREALSLRKIADSGQCFRPGEIGDGVFRFISGNEVLELRQRGDCAVEVSCDAETWERVWIPYFDLARDYSAIQQGIFESGDTLLAEATVHGDGIRVLRQEPFEMLVSFVLSQRKSIPAIRTAVRMLPRPTARRQRHLPERRSFSFRSRRRLPEARSKACGIWGSATARPMCWTPRAAWRTGSLISLRFANARMRNSLRNYRAYTASGRRSRTA